MERTLTALARCPYCRGSNVRPSRAQGLDRLVVWGVPCRCRSCRERFYRYPAGRAVPVALALAAVAAAVAAFVLRLGS